MFTSLCAHTHMELWKDIVQCFVTCSWSITYLKIYLKLKVSQIVLS